MLLAMKENQMHISKKLPEGRGSMTDSGTKTRAQLS